MTAPLKALVRAVESREMRIAVFDVSLRRQTGQWRLQARIDLADAIQRFGEESQFRSENGGITVPLHETDEPALTDEYLLVDDDADPPTVSFYDLSRGGYRTLPLDAIERTFPAWRARFWTRPYPIDEPPAFVEEFGASPGDEITVFEPVSPVTQESPPEAIIEAARSELTERRTEQRRRRRAAFAQLPVVEFIDDYGGIEGGVPAGRETDDFGQQTIVIELPTGHRFADEPNLEQACGISPGDVVIVDADGVDSLPVEAEIFGIENGRIELGVYWDTAQSRGAEEAFDPTTDTPISIGVLVDGRRYAAIDAALGTVERTDHALTRYAGRAELTYTAEAELPGLDVELNRDQRSAARKAIAAEGIALVRTPPGTGARRVLWTVIRETVSSGERVCIIGPDAASLERLIEGAGDPTIADRVEELGYSLHRCATGEPPPVGADVVSCPLPLATLVDDHAFDLAVLDHAAGVNVAAGAVPFAKAGRVLLFGDPMQSPRSAVDRAVTDPIAQSIYEHLADSYGTDAIAVLRCQYRMNQAIGLFPNREFYDSRLIHGQRNREWAIDATAPFVAYQVDGTERETPTGSAFNDAAVETIEDEILRLVDRGVTPDRIGVVTPSSAEVGKIRATLQRHDDDIANKVTVGRLDLFRCAHREVVIVSFVRGGDDGASFWDGPGLNVALTRAEKRLTLVGDWKAIADEFEGEPGGRLANFLDERGLIDVPP